MTDAERRLMGALDMALTCITFEHMASDPRHQLGRDVVIDEIRTLAKIHGFALFVDRGPPK